jgi:hypothetical protein
MRFNDWITKNCIKEMTSIDIDALIVRNYKKRLRVIEKKYINEGMKTGQKQGLILLKQILKTAEPLFEGWRFDVYIVRTDNPEEGVLVCDLEGTNSKELKDDELKRWCECEIDLDF